MSAIDSKVMLWRSVSALMRSRWGDENLNKLAKAARIGPATCARLKEQKTSVGLEVIDKLAAAFHVEAWQLLVPTFDPQNLPTLLPMSEAERQFYERMIRAARDLKNTEN